MKTALALFNRDCRLMENGQARYVVIQMLIIAAITFWFGYEWGHVKGEAHMLALLGYAPQ